MIALIIGCEVAFWIFILGGLASRYLLHRRRLGMALLAMSPLVDVVLLIAASVDMRSGAAATSAHGIAAIYLGFSIAYGHRLISWADRQFAYRFAKGPAPVKVYGTEYARACWQDVARTALAAAIAAAILWLLGVLATGPVDALTATYRILGIVVAVDLLWAVSYTVWPRRAPKVAAPERGATC